MLKHIILTVSSTGVHGKEHQCWPKWSWIKWAWSWGCVKPGKICIHKEEVSRLSRQGNQHDQVYSLGSIKVSLHLKALTPHASHFNPRGPQQLSRIRRIDIKHYCKLHHQNQLALEHVSTMAVQSSPGDSLVNLCNMLSLTSLGSSIFPWLKVALGRIINW